MQDLIIGLAEIDLNLILEGLIVEIKQCPCGASMTYLTQKENTEIYQVQCINCLEFGEEREIKENAIYFWNMKVDRINNCTECGKREFCDSFGEVDNCGFKL